MVPPPGEPYSFPSQTAIAELVVIPMSFIDESNQHQNAPACFFGFILLPEDDDRRLHSPKPPSVINKLFRCFTTLSNQLKSAMELSNSLQAQPAAAQSSISALVLRQAVLGSKTPDLDRSSRYKQLSHRLGQSFTVGKTICMIFRVKGLTRSLKYINHCPSKRAARKLAGAFTLDKSLVSGWRRPRRPCIR
ncbi:hypothetical protein PILCRDRAFT_15599 [Piloderma croceum F 1598]|uniref:Uncharacterized protein n=1 Tax=Piloderma croceum (strain F 1598) TaxID=765440 RepID=A0A0C3EZ39_PILCF|nr:hypothetical protein PILCRDRAFT_15599 [Piloderma croceum F 1598]